MPSKACAVSTRRVLSTAHGICVLGVCCPCAVRVPGVAGSPVTAGRPRVPRVLRRVLSVCCRRLGGLRVLRVLPLEGAAQHTRHGALGEEPAASGRAAA